jgi:hypothetical protein
MTQWVKGEDVQVGPRLLLWLKGVRRPTIRLD